MMMSIVQMPVCKLKPHMHSHISLAVSMTINRNHKSIGKNGRKKNYGD